MEYRQLGRSGLMVSSFALGTMAFGAPRSNPIGSIDVAGARRQIDRCLDAGVNLVDTANAYSDGRSEEVLGEAVAGRRDRLLLATKVRFPTGPGPNDSGLSRHHITAQLEASLRRLRTDHVDLYQLHEWDSLTPLEETMEALDTLVRSGKVRYIGASNFAGWQLMKALAVADRHGYQRFVSHQIYYSLECRDAEHELVPVSLDQGLGILVWGPLAGGLLSGKYRRGGVAPSGSRHLTDWDEPPVRDRERTYDVVDALVAIAGDHGVTPAEVALAYLLQKPAVTSLVIGARTDEQLEIDLRAVDLRVDESALAELDRISTAPLPYPYWHQAKTTGDRPAATGRP